MEDITDLTQYDTLSNDNKVGFKEEPHTYTYIPDPSIKFKSGSTVATKFEAEKDWDEIATKWLANHPEFEGTTAADVRAYWNTKSFAGTILHEYAEKALWKREDYTICDEVKDDVRKEMVEDFVEQMRSEGYEHEQVEKLVYRLDTQTPLCGLIDMELYKYNSKGEKEYFIYDYKFLSKPLDKTGFYIKGKGTQMMKGPFSHLPDTNFYHYSIQQAMYEFLDDLPIKEKWLVEFTPKGWKKVQCFDIKFSVGDDGRLKVTVPPLPKKKRKYTKSFKRKRS